MDCFSQIENSYHHKKVLILGLGLQEGGLEALFFFKNMGAEIRISDLKSREILAPTLNKIINIESISTEFGQHSAEYIKWADVIVRNPGVPIQHEMLVLARKLHKEIIMPSSFLVKHCPFYSIGITGTRGKSTTTNLIFQILKQNSQKKTYLAGNIPQFSPFKLVPTIRSADQVVLELSSWELQGFEEQKTSPNIAILTNIYPDHLNYYSSIEEYIHDKLQIFTHQSPQDYAITLKSTLEKYPQIKEHVKGQLVIVPDNYWQEKFQYLIGQHNQQNASLALKVAEIMNIDRSKAIKTISQFKGLPFRLEYKGTLKNSPVYNDSTSTTPIAGIKALEAMQKQYPDSRILLICGGNEKKLPFIEWTTIAAAAASEIFLLPGSFSELVKAKLPLEKLHSCDSLRDTFNQLVPFLKEKSVVLFSPAATSFAGFKNEFDRGQQFNQLYEEFLKAYAA